jgi:non-ribosomal peptide synthase protein (TIGR01720 family)
LDHSRFEAALNQAVQAHDAFRLRFRQGAAGWESSLIETAAPVVLERPEVSWETATAQLQGGLDIGNGPLFRAAWLDRRLILVVHHLIFDVVSWRVFLEDAIANYLIGKQPAAGYSFAAWSNQLRDATARGDWDEEIGYWTQMVDRINLMGRQHSQGNSLERSMATATLDAAETAALLAAQKTLDFRVTGVLLAALGMAYREVFRETCLPLSVEGHGREVLDDGIDLSRSIGWYTSQYPVVLDFAEDGSTAELTQRVREQLRSIPRNGFGYGLLRWLHQDADVRGRLTTNSRALVGFNFLGSSQQGMPASSGFQMSGVSGGDEHDRAEVPAHWLEVNARVGESGLEVSFAAATVAGQTDELASHFLHHLRALLECLSNGDTSTLPIARLADFAKDFGGITLDETSLAAIHADLEEFQL